MAARSVLGVPQVRPSFLDDLSAAEPRQTKNDHRVRIVTTRDNPRHLFLEDDDDLEDEDDDLDDEEEDEDDEDDEDEETETWQV